jgi:hypothetical protein
MTSTSLVACTLTLVSAGCLAETEDLEIVESPAEVVRTLHDGDGPLHATLTTTVDANHDERNRLSITYREPYGASFLLCHRFPNQPRLALVFVLGPEGAQTSVSRSMEVMCPTSYGDNVGQTNSASLTIAQDNDPAFWDTLFPPSADGSRWYALQLAANNAYGAWDSRYGHNYRLVLE